MYIQFRSRSHRNRLETITDIYVSTVGAICIPVSVAPDVNISLIVDPASLSCIAVSVNPSVVIELSISSSSATCVSVSVAPEVAIIKNQQSFGKWTAGEQPPGFAVVCDSYTYEKWANKKHVPPIIMALCYGE